MLAAMQMMWDALRRAMADGLRGKVIAWSFFPLLVGGLFTLLVAWWAWDPAVAWVHSSLQDMWALQWLWTLLGSYADSARSSMAALAVVLLLSPVMVVVTLLVVGVAMTPQMVELVAGQRFAHLERKHGGSVWASAGWSLWSAAIALLVLLLSIPLWWVPPFMLIIPPLVGGWLTYRVMAFDTLAEHASRAERQAIFSQHRYALWSMGLVCGLAGAAPSIVWASGVVFAAAFWLLIPLALWMYAWVLALSALWFTHFGLTALYRLRADGVQSDAVAAWSAPNAK